MMRAHLAVSWLFLCSFTSADLCVPFQNCQDQRIDNIVSVWSESNLPNPSNTPFRLQVVWKQRATALYSFSNHFPDDCSYEYSVELINDDHFDHGSIAGFIIQACANDYPVGQFVSSDTDTGWQPTHCLQTNDTAVYNSAFTRKSFPITWTAPCRSEDIQDVVFRYAVMDSLGHFYQAMEYSYSQMNPTKLAFALPTKKAFHNERIKRASSEAHLIVASQLFIQQLSLDGMRSTVLASGFHLQTPIAIDFHYRQNHIFWTDVATKTIMRSNLDGSMITTILDTGLNITDGLAVDWATDKLYWTDAELRRIGVFDLTNHHYIRELISTGTGSIPRAIIVDPQSRWMYWTDWGTVAKIEKASMDGSNRLVIHSTNLIWPNGLTLDYPAQILYWADARLDKIESSNVDGSNRRVIVSNGINHPFGITLFEDKLYLTDWVGDIRSVNKSGESSVQILYQIDCDSRPNGIQVFSEQRQLPAPSQCDSSNGNCSHLCLLSVTDPRGFTCACPQGMSLEANMHSCIVQGAALPPSPPSEGSCAAAGFSSCCTEGPCQGQPLNCYCDANCHQFGDCCTDVPADCLSTALNPYIMVAWGYFIWQLSLDGNRTSIAASGLTNAMALDFDYRKRLLFWTDTDEGKIWKSQLDGSGTFSIVESGIGVLDGIAVDWINAKLYWTDTQNKTVEVLDPSRGYRTALILTGRGSSSMPRAIVVDPQTRWMYWTDWGTIPKIEKASMDGSNRSVIHSTNLTWPNALALDYPAQVLYWADARLDKIESSNVDGSNRRVIVSNGVNHPFGITLFEDKLYFTDWVGSGVYSTTKSGGQAVQQLTNFFCTVPSGIQVIAEERQPQGQNPCGSDNGGCSHLCLLSAVDPRGFSCDCPDEMTLEEDGQNCTYSPNSTTTSVVAALNGTTPSLVNQVSAGSCRAANYTECCTSGACEGEPQNCFCDALCQTFKDCCRDALELCPPPGITLEFDERPESVSVVPLSSVNFRCSIHATSPPTIVWLYHSRESSSTQTVGDDTGPVSSKYSVTVGMGSSMLTVHNVGQSDEGIYICMATAGQQSINASVQLHIIILPVVTGNHTVGELGMISLQCSYAGGPHSMVVWLKRSEEEVKIVLNSSRVLVTHQRQTSGDVLVVTSNLTVHNVSTVDGGEYLCEATNGIFRVSNTVSIYINVTARNECTSERNYPCQPGGTCVDLVGRYECLCTSMYTGVNCSERVDATRTTEPSITRPPQNITAQLVQSINLTCEAESYPAPTYKWYKDDQLIPGETLPYLYIPEASPEDRGSYSCEASNTGGQASSNLAQIAIPGVQQYRVQVNQTGTASAEDILQEELLGIIGTTLQNSSATIYSIQVLNTTSSSSQGGEATYIVTMRQSSDEATPSVLVRRNLYERLMSFATFQVIKITRYDGCPAETTTLNTDDISHLYSWPDAEIGTTLFQPCPCEDIVGSQSGNTSRQCAGTFSNGGSWDQADYTQCAILSSEVTRHLCASAMGFSNPLNVSREVAALTTENLTPTDVSAATFIVEQLTQEAVRNSQVTQNYLQIVDNLQLADDETLLSSQTETNSSSRLLSSLATFSDEVEVSPNMSTRRTIYAFQNFALQVQDANLTAFAGETFSVDLGSVEEAMNNTHTINQSALVTMMEALSHATASAQIPNSVFDSCGNQGTLTNQIYDRANRLSYTVFRRSGLFQTSNTNNVPSSNGKDFFLLGNTNNSIGSIILGVRRRCAQNFSPLSSRGSKRTPREAPLNGSLEIPVQLQFRISQIMQEGSKSSNCVHWDATQNGGFGAWSPEGCSEVVTGSGNEKVCECTQLAHFGILFDLNPKPPPPAAALALSVLTYVGLSISLLCLFALLVTYLSSKKLRTSIHGQVLINLSLSLMGLYIFFLTGAHLTYIPVLCGISSALLHYFMLVFFGWTTAEAVLLYVKLVIIIGTQKIESRFILKAALGTWLVPLLIVAVSAGAGHDYYANPFYCRATEWPFWFGLILPFVLLYIINWVMFVIILVSVIKHNTAHSKDAGLRKLFKRNFVIAVGLAIVFGLGWGLGLIATSSSEEGVTLAFQIVFTIFVALQGLLLFAFHGIRNKDARQLWKEWCYAACVKSYKAYSASRSVAVSSVAGKGATMPSSISTDSAGFSTLGRQGAAKVKSVESENQTETSLDMSSCDTVLVTENPAYGEVQKQQQGTQQASPRYVEGQLDQEHHDYETAKTEVPPARRRSRKRSWLQSIVSSGKIDYQEIVSTPPPERKEFSSSAEGTGITDQPTDNSDEATAQPRKPRKSWITPFTSQSHIYEVLPESAENPPSKSRKKVSTSKLPKRGEHGTDDRQQEPIILEDEAEDEAQ